MKAIAFPQANKILTAPPGMSKDECQDLYTYTDGKQVISCWQLSPEEIAEILVTKKIWVYVLSGSTQPPIAVQVEHPFENPPE